MIRLLQFIFIAIFVLLIVRLVRLALKYFSSSKPSIDDLKDQAGKFKQKRNDIEEAEFREIPPEEEENSKKS
jgi:uncharacterized protein YpmB